MDDTNVADLVSAAKEAQEHKADSNVKSGQVTNNEGEIITLNEQK